MNGMGSFLYSVSISKNVIIDVAYSFASLTVSHGSENLPRFAHENIYLIIIIN